MSAFSEDPKTSLIALTRLKAQSRKGDVSREEYWYMVQTTVHPGVNDQCHRKPEQTQASTMLYVQLGLQAVFCQAYPWDAELISL